MRTLGLVVAISLSAACGGRDRAPAAPAGPSPEEAALDRAIDASYAPYLAFRPTRAVELGWHAYDGAVPPRSRAAIEAEIARLHAARAALDAIDPAGLPERRAVERDVALAAIRAELFDLEVRGRPWRDPFWYVWGYSLAPYVVRDYAPLAERGRALLAACEGGGAYWADAAANLEPVLPRAWLQVGAMIGQGTIQFLRGDARAAFAALDDAGLRAAIEGCLDRLAGEVGAFVDALAARMPAATDDFRLGADALRAMLREAEGLDVDLATLERLARADLARNLAALADAARAIDPARPVAEIVAEVTADKPDPDRVLDEARAQVELLRRFVVARDLVSVPAGADDVEVRATPAFRRGNFASLSGGGPFEPVPQPTFYYVSPPDPAWPEAEQRAYLPSRADLLFVTAHEVWPGHLVQNAHAAATGSRVLQTFETYTTSEGWAHYVEEMMWDEGLGAGDPRLRIGQLKNALLRDVRFVVALGYHAGTMTVDEAIALFQEHAFADPGNARQQALRGTVDPMFLGYTLGKLAILELRDDWRARVGPGAPLRDFHDAFLRHGEAPIPVIRRVLLGPDAGPPLAGAR